MNAKSIFLPFSNTFMPEFAVESARREASERSESFSITFAVLARRAGSGMSTASRSGDVTNLPKTETSGTQQTRKWTGWLRVDVGGIGLVCLPELLRMFVRRGHKTSQALVNMYVRSWNQLNKPLFNQMLITSLKSADWFRSGVYSWWISARWKGNDTWLTLSITFTWNAFKASRAWGSFKGCRMYRNTRQRAQTCCTMRPLYTNMKFPSDCSAALYNVAIQKG